LGPMALVLGFALDESWFYQRSMGIIVEIWVARPENLLVNWRSQAGCGFNLSTVCLL